MAKFVPIQTAPFDGGVDLLHERAALENGGYSQIQNFRPRRPGFESRLGQTKHHSANTDNTNEIISGYGFSKGRRVERSQFIQYSDGEVRKGTDNPPDTTTGEFGTQVLAPRHIDWAATTAYAVGDIVFSTTSKLLRFECTIAGTSNGSEPTWPALGGTVADNTVTWEAINGVSPASWANYKDYLMFADGAGQAQIYTGEKQVPVLVNVYKGTSMPTVPVDGADYLTEATDGLVTTFVILDSLDTLANNDAFFIGFDCPMDKITLVVLSPNGTVSTATVHYRKNDSTWADTSATDGTKTGTTTLAQTGSFTWTLPTDEVPHYAFGTSCFLYRITFSVALDAEVELTAVTGENTTGFQDVQNVWDGELIAAVQALTFDATSSAYYKYPGVAVKMTDFVWAGGANDYLYIGVIDKPFGGFLDVGETPNTTASSSIDEIAIWTDTGFTVVSNLEDGTNGGANSGYFTFDRDENARKSLFKGDVEVYWLRLRFDTAVAGAASMTWSFFGLSFYENIYPICQTIGAWDKRVWTSYDNNNLYGTATGFPMSVNGDDMVFIEVGDDRSNKIIAQRRFHNFCLVWQEEKGEEGGGFHIIQPGATAAGYAPQVISDKIGIMNNKSAVVLEDVGMTDLSSENPVMKGVFFISRYGVFKTDGRFLLNISGGIYNYYDSSRSEIIRAGYEDKHWLSWDSLYRVLRKGIVSGSSATKANVFLNCDYASNQWTQDALGQPLSSVWEVEAASGNVPVLQMGGSQDGYAMRLNNTNDDISTAIDKSTQIELDGEGWKLRLKKMAFVVKDQTAGNVIVDVYRNGAEMGEGSITAFADAGGGKVTVTSNGHGNSNGTKVWQTATTSYNGGFILSGVTTNTYDIVATWVANDATGSWTTATESRTLSMISSRAGYKGFRFNIEVMGDHLTIRIRNATASQPLYLLEYGVDVEKLENDAVYED